MSKPPRTAFSAVLHVNDFDVPGIGPLTAAFSERGLCALSFAGRADPLPLSAWRAAGYAIRSEPHPDAGRLEAQLRSYAAGRLKRFAITCDLRFCPPFTRRVLDRLLQVPFGSTLTYQELARAVGNPRASRAVGQAMRRNPVPIVIPCHRVVGSGWAGGYTPGFPLKQRLLAIEGVEVAEVAASIR